MVSDTESKVNIYRRNMSYGQFAEVVRRAKLKLKDEWDDPTHVEIVEGICRDVFIGN